MIRQNACKLVFQFFKRKTDLTFDANEYQCMMEFFIKKILDSTTAQIALKIVLILTEKNIDNLNSYKQLTKEYIDTIMSPKLSISLHSWETRQICY